MLYTVFHLRVLEFEYLKSYPLDKFDVPSRASIFTLLFYDMYVGACFEFPQGKFYLKKEENKGKQKMLPVDRRSIVIFV